MRVTLSSCTPQAGARPQQLFVAKALSLPIALPSLPKSSWFGRPLAFRSTYHRVSTAKQGRSGLGLEAQREALGRFAAAEGFEIVREYTEVETGKGADALDRRPQLPRPWLTRDDASARFRLPSSTD